MTKKMQRLVSLILCMVTLLSTVVGATPVGSTTAEQIAYDFMRYGLPTATVGNTPFSFGRTTEKKTYLVQDTFVGEKAQLKPIADFFLSQPWFYWSMQSLDGTATRDLRAIYDYQYGKTFVAEQNHRGSMLSIEGLTCVQGKPLGADARISDVLASQQVAPALLEAVKETFPDIVGDEWYISTVGISVMMGIIGGRPSPDGTGLIFAGDAPVTRAEWMVMLNRIHGLESYQHSQSVAGYKQSHDGVVPEGTWFLNDYNILVGSQGGLVGLYTLEELSQPVTRAEAALIFGEKNTGFDFPNHYNHRDWITYQTSYPDLVEMGRDVRTRYSEYFEKDMPFYDIADYLDGITVTQLLEQIKVGNRSLTYPFFSAMMELNINNIMNGYDDGNFHPLDTLTRAQALSLLLKACSLYPRPFLDSYDP